MDTNVALLLALIPASLVVVAAVIVRNAGPQETAGRRLLLLLDLITLAILVLLTTIQLLPPPVQQPLFWVSSLFVPVIFGLVILFIVYSPQIKQIQKRDRILILIIGLINAGLIAYHLQKAGVSVLFQIAPLVIFTLIVAWVIRGRTSRWVWILPGVVVLLWLMDYSRFSLQMQDLPQPLMAAVGISMFFAQVMTVATASLFVHSAMGLLLPASPSEEPGTEKLRKNRIEGILRLVMACILIAYVVNSAYWASIWDQTTDGLGGLAIASLAVILAIACGMVMSLRSSGKGRLVGIAFAVLVTISVQAGFRAGWDADFKIMTEQRAAQITRALDRFHNREDRYPQNLAELAPRDLLYVPRPVMFQGEDWCYLATANEYNLAAFFHEYFGLPVSLKVYASEGSLAGQIMPCQDRLADMQARHDWTNLPVNIIEQPTPTPSTAQREQLKTPIAREALAPIFADPGAILPYRWSPDGQWWFFRVPEPEKKQVTLYFFNASSRTVCSVKQTFPYDAYTDGSSAAWLAGERLLYLDGSESPAIFTPCQSGARRLEVPDGAVLTHVAAADPLSGGVLLQSADAYWLLQADGEEIQKIQGVQPTPYEAHWDHAAWNPAGSRLVISHLNSREPKDGITLYLIDAKTVQVTYSQKMNLAFEQSAPFIEWVSNDEILMNGPDALVLLDFRSDPIRQIDVMKDIFNLEIKFPDQVSSNASVPSSSGSGYHLSVWANHPNNQSLYVYHAENGQVSVYPPKDQAVLIFPDGQWTPMTRLEDLGQAEDVLSLYWIDSSFAPIDIHVSGHQPRGYPRLDVQYLPETSQLLLDSSNGVSLVSVPDGNLLHFWQTGVGGSSSPHLTVSPDGKTVLSIVEGVGIFQIPIDK